ncbi:MAG TPA: zinc dependent phospholipase C family protein, partial [Longimicrobium sp.]|nr:zinc dependent phospholipase C family protein [Longimicrobium sp.]
RNAFLHGALGPDMGYFPGADPLLAELAHHARTGAFCRALVGEARTDEARAFAWGWVTHVLADVAVHPLVNEACGELATGVRTPLWGAEVAVAHLRVETGLDAACHARHPELARLRGLPALDPGVFHAVRCAYLHTYGAAPDAEALVHAHRQVVRLLGPGARVRGVAACAVDGRGAGAWAARMALRAAARLGARNAHAEGLFSPVRPAPWLLDEVDAIAAGFADWFGAHYASGLRFLRDHCLDTGEAHDHDQPCARAAIDALRARWAAAPELLRAAA